MSSMLMRLLGGGSSAPASSSPDKAQASPLLPLRHRPQRTAADDEAGDSNGAAATPAPAQQARPPPRPRRPPPQQNVVDSDEEVRAPDGSWLRHDPRDAASDDDEAAAAADRPYRPAGRYAAADTLTGFLGGRSSGGGGDQYYDDEEDDDDDAFDSDSGSDLERGAADGSGGTFDDDADDSKDVLLAWLTYEVRGALTTQRCAAALRRLDEAVASVAASSPGLVLAARGAGGGLRPESMRAMLLPLLMPDAFADGGDDTEARPSRAAPNAAASERRARERMRVRLLSHLQATARGAIDKQPTPKHPFVRPVTDVRYRIDTPPYGDADGPRLLCADALKRPTTTTTSAATDIDGAVDPPLPPTLGCVMHVDVIDVCVETPDGAPPPSVEIAFEPCVARRQDGGGVYTDDDGDQRSPWTTYVVDAALTARSRADRSPADQAAQRRFWLRSTSPWSAAIANGALGAPGDDRGVAGTAGAFVRDELWALVVVGRADAAQLSALMRPTAGELRVADGAVGEQRHVMLRRTLTTATLLAALTHATPCDVRAASGVPAQHRAALCDAVARCDGVEYRLPQSTFDWLCAWCECNAAPHDIDRGVRMLVRRYDGGALPASTRVGAAVDLLVCLSPGDELDDAELPALRPDVMAAALAREVAAVATTATTTTTEQQQLVPVPLNVGVAAISIDGNGEAATAV